MGKAIDSVIALRVLYLLTMPFKKWKAFEEGIIDENGEKIKEGEITSDNWTMLHRLVWRLKKLIGKLPGGKSMVASMTAAYLLVKESDQYMEEYSDEELIAMLEAVDISVEYDKIESLLEEITGVGNCAGMPPVDAEPPVTKTKYANNNRKRKQNKLTDPSLMRRTTFMEHMKNAVISNT